MSLYILLDIHQIKDAVEETGEAASEWDLPAIPIQTMGKQIRRRRKMKTRRWRRKKKTESKEEITKHDVTEEVDPTRATPP